MDLDFSEEQETIRAMLRGVLAEHCPSDVVRKLEDDPVGYPSELWKQLGELGVIGMLLPEAYGGGDQSLLDAAIVYEELGRALAPTPHFASAVMAGGVLNAAGSESQKQEWLPQIAAGEAIVSPAWLEPDRGETAIGVQLSAAPDGDHYRLDGVKRHVAFAGAATMLLVLARTGEGEGDVDLFLVDPASPGIRVEQQLSMASDAQFRVEFSDVRVPASSRVGSAATGWNVWEAAMLEGMVLLAAQAVGGAEKALEITVEYAKERKQFDKPLGAFQAISHYLADASTRIDGARTLVYEAAWVRSVGRPIDQLGPMAKLFACETYRETTRVCEQIWGGVGFTIEYDIQLYFRRAKQLQLSWWDTRSLEERIAATVLDG